MLCWQGNEMKQMGSDEEKRRREIGFSSMLNFKYLYGSDSA